MVNSSAIELPDLTGIPFEFPDGLPGFAEHREFYIFQDAAIEPLCLLQSSRFNGPCFVAAPVSLVDHAYALEIEHADWSILSPSGERSLADIRTFFVLTFRPGTAATANMLAPILINVRHRKGVQAVRSDLRYSHAEPLLLQSPADSEASSC
jgi:flagellar assembly factor FliW